VVKFGLSLGIYLRNPSADVNRTFAIVFFGQAIWDLGKFLMWMSNTEFCAMIWAKVSYSGYIISVFFLLSFVWVYLKKKNYFTTAPGRVALYAPMVLMLVAVWVSHGVVQEMIPPDELSYGFGIELWDYNFGPVYNYFFLWFQIIPFIYAFILFVFKYFSTTRSDKKKQLMYLVIGSAFPIMLGIPTGIILPSLGVNLPPHNNLLSLIMSVFIAIGIIKYKFLAIQPIGEKIVPGRKLDQKLAQQYKLAFGNAYFIKHEKSSEIAHKVLLTELYKNHYGLIITAHNPSKIRHEYGIETTPIVWITDTETEHLSVDPIDIEQLHETIRMFLQKVPNSFVLIDGVDYLLAHNNFSKIHHFLKQVKELVSKSDDCLIVPKGALVLEPKHEKMLEAEFNVLPAAAKKRERGKEVSGKKKKMNYVIIGHNPLAQSVISEFEKSCTRPTVVEKKEVLVHYPKGVVNLIKGDPLSGKVLEHAGVTKPNTVVLITLEDDSDVILCINKIRQLSDSSKIITNIKNQNFIPIAMKAGADKVIPSSDIGGRLISLALTTPDIVRWVMDATTYSAKELELSEVRVDRKLFAGKTVQQVDARLGKAGNVIGVRTVDGLKQIPADDYSLKEGDNLIVVVNLKHLPKGKYLVDRLKALARCRKK
jgi:voltage-gated potassium channel